jgi:hypothetical protein
MKFYVKNARLGYDKSLFEAKPGKPTADNPNPKAKFQATFIVEPTTLAFAGDANPDSVTGKAKGYQYGDFKTALQTAILSVAQEKLGPQWQAILAQLKAQNRLILHDGAEKAMKPGYIGNHYFNASADDRPVLRNKNGAALTATDGVLHAGCYVDGAFDVWAFPKRQSVNITLLVVTFAAPGERLAGGVTASEDDYAAVSPEAQAKAVATGGGASSLFANS